MPRPDFVLREHLVVAAPPEATYEAVGLLRPSDLGSSWVRSLVTKILLGDQWILLGERPGQEIAIGAAGRFWTPFAEWQEVTPEGFAHFSVPRNGTIALSFAVRSHGEGESLVTFTARVAVADTADRRQAGLYWRLVKPVGRVIARAMLQAIRDRATNRPGL